MKRTSAFLELAENHNKNLGVCIQLFWLDESGRKEIYFKSLFQPSSDEREKYNMNGFWWLEEIQESRKSAWNFRILCLLLAHEIWCDTIDTDK